MSDIQNEIEPSHLSSPRAHAVLIFSLPPRYDTLRYFAPSSRRETPFKNNMADDPTSQANFLQIISVHVDFVWNVDFKTQLISGSVTHTLKVKEDGVNEVMWVCQVLCYPIYLRCWRSSIIKLWYTGVGPRERSSRREWCHGTLLSMNIFWCLTNDL